MAKQGARRGRAEAYQRQRASHDRAQRLRETARQSELAREQEARFLALDQERLERLSTITAEFEATRQREIELRLERDALISALRQRGHSWNALAMRTGLSRQALSKRT
jgi:hypothetical protein